MKKVISNNVYLFKLIWRYDKKVFFLALLEGILRSIYHVLTSLVYVKVLIDKISNSAPFAEVMQITIAMALFHLLFYAYNKCYNHLLYPIFSQKLHLKMQSELYEKAKSIDLLCYEDPEFYSNFVWAMQEADTRVMRWANDVGVLINRIISTILIISILFTIDPYVVLAIALSLAVSLILKIKRNKISLKREESQKPIQIRKDYFGRVFYLYDYAKEIRCLPVSGVLIRNYDDTIQRIKYINEKYGKKIAWISISSDFVTSTFLNVGVTLFLLFRMMIQTAINLGSFVSSIYSMKKLFWQLESINDYIARFNEHSLYSEKIRYFLDYDIQIKDLLSAIQLDECVNEINFQNICFKYPNSHQNTLNNINLRIKKGEKIAIVGYNGAGKSTLIKLLLRLYDPSEGEILINNNNRVIYQLESYRKKFGSVFQDYQIFAASIKENIIADNLDLIHYDEKTIKKSLIVSGLWPKIEKLPHQLDTVLTKEFDKNGEIFSGGENQKLAIARAIANNCDVIVLDEPSSALDPIAEYELNKILLSSANEKTIIFISHRLSTTVMADRIYMLDKGKIIEQGSHEELIKKNGKYAYMFRLQADKYCNN